MPGSGSIPGLKSDVVTDKLRIEAKTTTKKSMSVKQAWLEKIDEEAGIYLTPALAVRFEGMKMPTEKDWVMIPLSKLMELLGE